MSKSTRLITLRQIKEEKISRGRSWIYAEIAAGRFPKPLPLESTTNLWEEAAVDEWVEAFIARAKARQASGQERTAKATEARCGLQMTPQAA